MTLSPTALHGRPRYDKLSFNDFEQVKIAAIHPDFMQSKALLSLMESAE
ncbi:MAG: hypothetical protein IPP22_11545 [Nitrosomonas sp.]|nr:hypothetical protein [Nitrosomonas sp.]